MFNSIYIMIVCTLLFLKYFLLNFKYENYIQWGIMVMKVGLVIDSIIRGPTSVGNYIRALIEELLRLGKVELVFLYNENQIYRMIIKNFLAYFKYYFKSYTRYIEHFDRIIQEEIGFFHMSYLRKKEIDILHIPHLAGATAPSMLYSLSRDKVKDKVKFVVTLHGVAPLVLPPNNYYNTPNIQNKLFTRSFITLQRIYTSFQIIKWNVIKNKIDFMITVSNSEKQNIVEKLKISDEKIEVIYHGIDHENFKPMNNIEICEELRRKYGINFDFILHVSSYQPKKNVEGIIEAFAFLKKNTRIKEKLVIVGRQPESVKMLARRLGLVKDVVFLGHVPYEDLPKIYNLAKVFVFPSFHESFGMPILEAMACGCPVITSNVFSMPEIAGDAAILVNPYKIEEIAEAIYKVLSDENLRRKLKRNGLKRAKRFTWEKSARAHLKVYKEVTD